MYETHNPVEDRFGFRTQGIFRCAKPSERISIVVIVVCTLLLSLGWYLVLYVQLRWYFGLRTDVGVSASRTMGFLFLGVVTLLVLTAVVLITFILHGNLYSYTANDSVFSFRCDRERIPKTDIRYDDVASVEYREMRLFGKWQRGFEVTVITRSLGSITFRYLFNKSIPNKTHANTPFHIIEERAALL